ncbi:MAG: hypothetical protein JNM66_09545 [Bryobacterales bacterium]|nr:hypothetical protein [Bryobacterales bacterium]
MPRPGLSRWLIRVAAPLGAASLGFAVYFGIEVWRLGRRPARPLQPPANMEQALGVMFDVAGDVSEGIAKQFLAVSLLALGLAAALYLLGRKLRGPV